MSNLKIFGAEDSECLDRVSEIALFYPEQQICLMPNANFGHRSITGLTSTNNHIISPLLAGTDIGCGTYVVKLGHIKNADPKIWLHIIKDAVPSGRNCRTKPFNGIEQFQCAANRLLANRCEASWFTKFYIQRDHDYEIENSLATLGGGDHFVAIQQDKLTGDYYLLIHTGSRVLGKRVTELYQFYAEACHRGADKLCRQLFELHKQDVDPWERSEHWSAQRKLINKIKKAIERVSPDMPQELCSFNDAVYSSYKKDTALCTDWARINREAIAACILGLLGIEAQASFHSVHNSTEGGYLRKGAISAVEGKRGVITLGPSEGSLLVIGKGNPYWNCSAPSSGASDMTATDFRNLISNAVDIVAELKPVISFPI